MNFLFWLMASWALVLSGAICTQLERESKGKGTWYPDRELLVLSGACYALALVCVAMAIEAGIFT